MIELEESRACITVAIVSANQLVRIGLQSVLRDRPQIQLVGIVASGREAEEVVAQHRPQVLLIEWQDARETLTLVQTVKVSVPSIKIIALSGMDSGMHIQAALSAGIHAFVLNIQPPEVMVATIEHVARGATGMAESSRTGRTVRPRAEEIGHAVSSSRAGMQDLTKREREVTTLIGEGLANKDIAGRLGISSITVRHHLTSIFDKLGIATRQKLLICAHQYGLVELKAPALPLSIDA
ncbi:MAG TPA: response regulator transcription factor [Nitrospira sp.]|nr:response regulator transcription factor [Candidatus Nomurabacteria bacterium]HNP80360.1 response regulator transcription factor [Nitrospira sp.]